MKTKGIYFLYRFLQAFGSPFVLVYFAARGLRNPAYLRTVWQRLGFLPATLKQTSPGAIWLHAVSLGEVVACAELVRQLRERLPRTAIFVSVSTLAGHRTAVEKLGALAAGVFYAPLDYVFAVRRVLRTLRPSVVIVAETEIWPNLFREARRNGSALLMVNARISDRALPRYVRFAWFFRAVLPAANVILAQSEVMRQRFLELCARPEATFAGGNLKYDFQPREAPADSPVRQLLATVRPRHIWIAASTMPPAAPGDVDEDDAVLEAFRQVSAEIPDLLLILVPRRPERFETAARKLASAGIPFIRRSVLRGEETVPLPGALLVDTIGELSGLFSLADVVFMGGTLASRGGHNILEPAFFARPIIAGPHLENFEEIAREFRAAGALLEISGAAELAAAVRRLLREPGFASEIGDRALACARARQGATRLAADWVERLYAGCFPRQRPFSFAWTVLWPVAQLWEWGGRRKFARDRARCRRLEQPVISVGNITMGGTGKTPFVLYLAGKLRDAGHRPGILTRGYGRHSPEKYLILAAGARVPVERTGDEPQMFLNSGLAPVGIGPDRFHTGRLLEKEFDVDVLILDDGFQHVRLARQIDIVLIDALNPFGGGEVFPLGRLREPLEGLARADVFVVTRSDYGSALAGIDVRLRRYNPRAPIFHARVVPHAWVEYSTGRELPPDALPYTQVAAFCGLGNPDSFWHSLRSLGLNIAGRLVFGDHHAYRPQELRRMADHFRVAGAEAVVTTEKDTFNLCDDCTELLSPLPLYWLKIGLEIDSEEEFLRAVAIRSKIHD